jgi:hypothetical protein
LVLGIHHHCLHSGWPVLGNRINFVNHSILTICNGAGERAMSSWS